MLIKLYLKVACPHIIPCSVISMFTKDWYKKIDAEMFTIAWYFVQLGSIMLIKWYTQYTLNANVLVLRKNYIDLKLALHWPQEEVVPMYSQWCLQKVWRVLPRQEKNCHLTASHDLHICKLYIAVHLPKKICWQEETLQTLKTNTSSTKPPFDKGSMCTWCVC